MSAPGIYAAIHAICAELAVHGIPKSRVNEVDGYKYRSIDDLLDALAPLLAKHRLCILPRVQERAVAERFGLGEGLLLHVALRVAFTLTSVDDATSHVVESYGEALDAGDKATAKAMSMAYKSAMIQTFCIPIAAGEDPDRTTHRLRKDIHAAEPVQGWDQWSADIREMIGLCESEEAIRSVERRQREFLRSISRERPALYGALGQAFSDRREQLTRPPQRAKARGRKKTGTKRRSADSGKGVALETSDG